MLTNMQALSEIVEQYGWLYSFVFLISKIINPLKVPCSDPGWMASDTYYPHATTCYKDDKEERYSAL